MKVYSIIQSVILGALLILIVSIVVLSFAFNISAHIVLSGSMEPAIMTGSICFVDEKDKDIKEGDIIAFRRGDILVTHRVVEIDGQSYVTKGDANSNADFSPVKKEDVLGTTVASIKKAGYVAAFLKSPRGALMVTCLFLAFIILGRILEKGKGGEGENTKKK